jgi:hypothetical protein
MTDQFSPDRQHRPGPFGPAWALLPQDQELLCLDRLTPVSDAIERMIEHGYSQIPVRDETRRIIGVFTWKSFGQRISELLHVGNLKLRTLSIKDAMEHPVRFIAPDVYIDTETDWDDIDYVLVGAPDEPLGLLCVSDVLGRLNDFAEAFVLIYEIEQELRSLIADVYTDEDLRDVLKGMATTGGRPVTQVIRRLTEVVDEYGKSGAIKSAITLLTSHVPKPLNSVDEFTFGQYRQLICNRENWLKFEPIFQAPREMVQADFSAINDLRNSIFHFREAITLKDTDRLRRFRDQRRYDRELFMAGLSKTVGSAEATRK